MYSITDLKKGTVIQLGGVPFKVVEYNQKQVGRGGSIVNTKLKNLLDGSTLSKTFKGAEKVESAELSSKTVQFLYAEGDNFHFMDPKSFDQFSVDGDLIGDAAGLLAEGSEATAQLHEGRVINLELPTKVTLKVADAPSVVRGDTQSTVMKEVLLETGAKIQAPIFINTGDQLVVDTRDNSYVERAK